MILTNCLNVCGHQNIIITEKAIEVTFLKAFPLDLGAWLQGFALIQPQQH